MQMISDAQVAVYANRCFAGDADSNVPFGVRYVTTRWDDAVHGLVDRYPRWARRLGVQGLRDLHYEYARRVAVDLDEQNPDIVHVMNYWQWARQLRGRPSRGRKVVLEMQCEWLSQMERDKIARQLESVDAVVGVSDHITSLFKAAFPSYAGVTATAYNGVDVDVFKPTGDPKAVSAPRVLWVGRVSPEKGVHTLLDAFAEVVREFPAARLDLVGAKVALPADLLVGLSADPLVAALARFYDGSIGDGYQEVLESQVRRLGIERSVRFVGGLPHAELVAAYQSASLVVNPSLSESFGITLVEGMACGVPVIGTRVGGMLETVVHGETGLLVEPEQPSTLAEAMIKMLSDRRMWEAMSTAGRERAVARFSWAARARRLRDAYRRIG
jgi:glycosyltransferase involved in cell wall biosynthesis